MLTLNSVLSLNAYTVLRGVFRNLLGGLKFCILSRGGGAQHPLGLENPLKSIDFTYQGRGGKGGAIAHIALPE